MFSFGSWRLDPKLFWPNKLKLVWHIGSNTNAWIQYLKNSSYYWFIDGVDNYVKLMPLGQPVDQGIKQPIVDIYTVKTEYACIVKSIKRITMLQAIKRNVGTILTKYK